jgi:FMN-dependent NADH-azoreductase
MTTILRIDSSIKGPASVTRRLTDRITARLAGAAGAEVTSRDATAIPLIDGTWIGAAHTPADSRSDDQRATLALSDAGSARPSPIPPRGRRASSPTSG